MTEIKKLILKDNPGHTVESNLNDARLLSVLTHGSTGRNPTFFKALGHDDVFGLRSSIPDGSSTQEVAEEVPNLEGEDGTKTIESNVLYVRLPDGHPVLKSDETVSGNADPTNDNSDGMMRTLSIEEAIEQAEVIFGDESILASSSAANDIAVEIVPDDDNNVASVVNEASTAAAKEEEANVAVPEVKVTEPMAIDVTAQPTNSNSLLKRTSPRISPRLASKMAEKAEQAAALSPKEVVGEFVDVVDIGDDHDEDALVKSDAKFAAALAKSESPTPSRHHNLRPKRTLRHVQALKQQAKRRKRNTNLASASGATPVQRVSSASKKSSFNMNGDIEINYKPSAQELRSPGANTMKDVLHSIPGFSLTKIKKKAPKKLSVTAAIQMAAEGSVDMDSPDSILGQVNLRTLVNKNTFLKLPPQYQFKLMQLLPQVDTHIDHTNSVRLNHSSLNNEFFAKASQEWKERLLRGDFTPEVRQKNKMDADRDRQSLDPWKARHFEPVWGVKNDYSLCDNMPEVKPNVEPKSTRRRSRQSAATPDVVDAKRSISDEDEPLLKRLKHRSPTSTAAVAAAAAATTTATEVKPSNEVVVEETVIEEPVNVMEEEERQQQKQPSPSFSYNLDEVSIPSPIIITPVGTPPVPVLGPAASAASSSSSAVTALIEDNNSLSSDRDEGKVSTPLPTDVPLPTEPLPLATISGNSSPAPSLAKSIIPASPASIAGRRDSIRSVTFSSSRSPSPAYSNPLSMASSAQEVASAASPSVSATYSEQEETSSQASAADVELVIGTPEPTSEVIAPTATSSTASNSGKQQELVLQVPVSEIDQSVLPKTFAVTKATTVRILTPTQSQSIIVCRLFSRELLQQRCSTRFDRPPAMST